MTVEKATPAKAAELTQDPPRARDGPEKTLELAIGRALRGFRRRQEVTVAELASRTGLSIGMLSKIENGNTSPSLKTLQALATALSIPISAFFSQFDVRREVIHTKSGEGIATEEAGSLTGHETRLLGQPYLVTLTSKTDVLPSPQQGGTQTIYMLEGEMDYRHGDKLYNLTAGDSLQFDADSPHGPEAPRDLPLRYLSIVSVPQNG